MRPSTPAAGYACLSVLLTLGWIGCTAEHAAPEAGPTKSESVALLEQLRGGVAPSVTRQKALVTLPPNAGGAFRVSAPAGLSVEAALEGAKETAGVAEGEYVVYRAAWGGSDVVHRVTPEGLEDFVLLRKAAAESAVSYRLSLSKDVAGLRLVANTLEFLDGSGTPQLRVAPPYLLDAEHNRREAKLSVEGCAVDRSPALPFFRKVTPPKSRSCLLRVSWDAAGLSYPALLDPSWSTTGNMAARRGIHSSSSITVSSRLLVLVAGGYDGTSGSDLSSAEVFDPDSNGGVGVWTVTGSMSTIRQGHTATVLLDGTVLVAGGSSYTPGSPYALASSETYNPSTGLWTTRGNLAQSRANHTATLLASGKVLVAGGNMADYRGCITSTNTAELYDPSTGNWSSTSNSMLATRAYHTATLLSDGRVLVAGGYTPPPACGTGASWSAGAELYNPSTNSWATTGNMTTNRSNHQAVLLPNGTVLVAGGETSANSYFATAEVYTPTTGTTGTWAAVGSMLAGRADYVLATVPVNGQTKVVAIGGSPSYLQPSKVVDLFEPTTLKWFSTNPLGTARRLHAGSAVAGSRIVISGGDGQDTNGVTTYLNTAEVFDPSGPAPTGLTCSQNTDCVSGFCADGFCCNSACSGQCDRCDQSGTQGTCTVMNASYLGSPSCGSYYCDGTNATCPASCTKDAQCTAGNWCDSTGHCSAKLATGQACDATGQARSCQSGNCADGYCCNTACTGGSCDRCDLAGTLGTCTIAPQGNLGNPACGSTVCNGVVASCPSTCQTDVDCIPGDFCSYNASWGYGYCYPKQALGTTCSVNNACTSGICTDGVCCDLVCNGGPCDRCDLATSLGHCVIVPEGGAGNPSCGLYQCDGTDAYCPASCTSNLDCNATGAYCGNGTCQVKKSNGATCGNSYECSSGFCVDGYCCNSACSNGCDRCNLPSFKGTCTIVNSGNDSSAWPDVGQNPSCAPYVCNAVTATCPTGCSVDSNCAPGSYCSSGMCVAKVATGSTCTAANQCASGFCADGYCCNAACSGGCDVCNQAGALGTCTTLAAGSTGANPSCGGYLCSGTSGACPTTCTSDSNCIASDYCDSGTHTCQAKKANGGTCSAVNQCASGFCVDGYCCNSACSGQCQACNATNSLGTCKTISGVPVGARTQCTGAGTTCGGSCDGTHTSCMYPSGGTICTSASCANNAQTSAASCDGAGTCVAGTTQSCNGFACGGTTCKTACYSNVDCLGGYFCDPGTLQCLPLQANGVACTNGTQCASGTCADGVCCDQACNGQCEACSVSGHVGTCTAVTGQPAFGHPTCSGTGLCAGACDGTNRTSCSYPSTSVVCTASQCSGNIWYPQATCNGGGACIAPSPVGCSPYVCGANSCLSHCQSDNDCTSGLDYCDANGTCQPKKSQAAACGSAHECASGFCADGVCCDGACSVQCKACNLSGHVGQCSYVTGSPVGARTACSGSGLCGASCTGASDTCQYPGALTCRAPTCLNGVATTGGSCDGSGSCTAPITKSCAPYVCGATDCLGTCNSDTDCSTGNYCDTTSHSCQPKSYAGACSSNTQCASGYCVDGLCCDRACNGQCEACNVSGHEGTCSPVAGAPVGTRTACGGSGVCGGYCDGAHSSACVFPGASTVCSAAVCLNGQATTAAVCDGGGNCGVGVTTSCGAYQCQGSSCASGCTQDSDCTGGGVCQSGTCVYKKGNGAACALGVDCLSGNCVDGFCCDTACNGQCEACGVSGHEGTCTAVVGAPPIGRARCFGDGSACGGYCDGVDRAECHLPGLETQCRAGSCAGSTETAAAFCNGTGACPPMLTQSCGAYTCGAIACLSVCAKDADCASDRFCNAGACVPKSVFGATCSSDGQCAAGHCVDGVCCNTACDGQCEACNEPNHPGICTPVAGAPRGPQRAQCGGSGLCAGACDGLHADACAFPTPLTVCGGPFCAGNTAFGASFCDGQGDCSAPSASETCSEGCLNGACLMPPDAGVDAGTAPDGGVVEDAGSPPDSGFEPDAGRVEDAGALVDAGAGTRDAGQPPADAGSPPPAKAHGGCATAGDSLGLLIALAAVIARRRTGAGRR